jgi:hypothetical protein
MALISVPMFLGDADHKLVKLLFGDKSLWVNNN